MAFVYHIHLPQDEGNFDKGYIGFTSKTVEQRFYAHCVNAYGECQSSYHLYNAMRKYKDNICVTTLVESDVDYCLDLEFKLRPKPNIGWNTVIGGGKGMLGMKHTTESRKKMSESLKGKFPSDETRAKLSAASKGKPKTAQHAKNISEGLLGAKRSQETCDKLREALNKEPWNLPQASKSNWLLAQKIRELIAAGVKHKNVMIECGFDKRSSALKHIIRRVKAGWNPLEDEHWLAFKASHEKDNNGTQPI